MIRTGGVLTLDLGSEVGHCYGHAGDDQPIYGTWLLANSSLPGAKYASFENELIEALDLYQPSLCSVASPMLRGTSQGSRSAEQQLGLYAYAQGACYRARVQIRPVFEGTARKDVLGRGTFPKGVVKPTAIAWCRANGFMVGDDHQADAIILWRHQCGVQNRLRRY